MRNEIKFPLWRYCSICLKWGQSKLQILHRERPLLHIYKQQNWFDAVKCIYTLKQKIHDFGAHPSPFRGYSLVIASSLSTRIGDYYLKTLPINIVREGVSVPGRLGANGTFHVQCLVKSRLGEDCLDWARQWQWRPLAVTRL